MINLSDNSMSRGVLMDMVRILTKQRRGINVCHINAQSIKTKIDEFRLTFENSGIDVLCVSETWLNKDIPDSLISLSGYKVYRADRKTLGGGVAIFLKQGISCKVVSKSKEGDKIEYLFLEIYTKERKLLLGCMYRPYGNISLESINASLETIAVEYSDVIIVGDFNSNLLAETTLMDSMAVFGLQPTNLLMPTHYTATSSTLLDVFFVSDTSRVQLYDQLSASCFSKHDLIFLSYEFYIEADDETYSFRDFAKIDYEVLQEDINRTEWNRIYYMPSVDDQQTFLEENIKQLYDSNVPLRTRTKRFKSKPWFNLKIKQLISERNLAYSRWKRFKTNVLRDEFRRMRKEVNKEIKRSKCEYFSFRFSQTIDSKGTWKTIRDIGHCKRTVLQDHTHSANDINESFLNIPMATPNPSFYENLFVDPGQMSGNFEFTYVNERDVMLSCLAVKSNAIGYDNIDPKFVRLILPQILPYITHLFNTIVMSSSFPNRWRHAKIIPIPKNGTEFRPIAILPFFSKVMEKLMHAQMISHLNKFSLLSERQSGFRQKHSCVTALIDVAEDLRSDMDQDKLVILVLLDHSKAFDTVDHGILYSKLKFFFSYSSTAVKLIQSYLGNRSQSVYLKNDVSDPLPTSRGVPQGSILGPLLFSCYVNDLPKYLENCKIHMYADDVQMYIGTKICSIQDAVRKVNCDLKNVHDWAGANGLCLNPLKSKCLIIHGRTRKQKYDVNIILNGQKIEIVESAKNLGIIFNKTLTWSNHVSSIVGATYSKLRAFWSTQSFTPQRIRLLLAKTYIMPSLLYGCEVFSSCDSLSKRRLNIIFNNVCRYVYGIGRYDHISNYNLKLYGVSLENLFKIRVLLLLHKVIYEKSPPYLFDRLKFARSNRGNLLISLRHRKLVSDWQFYIHATRLWNTLPHYLQTISNATQFKKAIHNHFLN